MTNIPTISQIAGNLQSSIEASYGTNIPSFGKNFLRVLCLVLAGNLKLIYLAVGNVQKNIFIDTADPEALGGSLERFGRVKLGRNPFPAKAGQYILTLTGTAGSIIPSGTTFKSNDDSLNPGKLYILDAEHEMAGSSDTIQVRALEAGSGSKLEAADQVTATAPIIGVNRIATVDAEAIEPQAAEDLEDYREKGLLAYRLEPNGGAQSDFVLWANDAQGVKRAYPYAKTSQSAVVDLYIEATAIDSTDGMGTPSAGLLADVEAVVELDPDVTKSIYERGRRPLGAWKVNYLPITVKEVKVEVVGYQGLTPTIQNEIENAIREQINLIRPFRSGVDVLAERNDVLNVNKIVSTIFNARTNSVFDQVILKLDDVVILSHQFTNGDIPYLISVSFT